MTKKIQSETTKSVFQIQPQSNTRIKCRQLGTTEESDKLNDEILADDTPLLVINGYSVFGKFCACNLAGQFLVENDTLPVYYMPVMYTRSIVHGCLFNVAMLFTADESKKKLDNEKKYVGTFLDGMYTFKIVVPGEEKFIDKIKSFVKNDVFTKYVTDFDNANTEEQVKIVEIAMKEVNDKIDSYRNFMDGFVFTDDVFPSKKLVHKKLTEICKSGLFKELINYGLLLREKERREQRGPDMSFEPPKRIISLRDSAA